MASDNLVITTGASSQIPVELNSFQASAWNAIAEARRALDDMSLNRPTFPEGAATPGVVGSNITYTPPGNAPIWDFTFSPPEWDITDPILKDVEKNQVDEFTGSAPVAVSPNIPARPSPVPVTAPGDAPDIANVTIPDIPDLKVIDDPKEWAISLPGIPTIDIAPLSLTKPGIGGITKPTKDFQWNENPYTSETLDCVIARVGDFCQGGVGIPDSVWEALWAKDNDRENRAAVKLKNEVNEEWSNRGFQLPQGVQTAQIQEISQSLQHTISGRSRDIAIRESDLAIENLRFAVQQGIALENMRGGWYQVVQNRLLEATKFASELSVSVFNAEISFYNAQVQMYLADVEAYKIGIDAELVKLEVYKSELEGQKLIGDLNEQQVQIYATRVQALTLEIDRYNSIIQGIKTTVEIDAVRIEGYRVEVQAFGEKIKAINSEYEGYATSMQGAKIEADIYESNVRAFASNVQAYSSRVDAEATNANIDIDINKYKLNEYSLRITGFVAELEAEVKNLQAASSAFDAKNSAYIAGIDGERANIQAQTAKYTGDIQLASQTTQVNIANSETNARNALAQAQIIQKGLESIAQINAAYSSSALSAVNMSMSMGDSAGNSASI